MIGKKMTRILTFVSLLCCSIVYGHDSTYVTIPHFNQTPIKPYVLATGNMMGAADCENYCNKGQITETICPENFHPFVMTSPVYTEVPKGHRFPAMCEKHMRSLLAKGRVEPNSSGGYDLWLATKVATDGSCYDAGVEVNYVVYCQSNNMSA